MTTDRDPALADQPPEVTDAEAGQPGSLPDPQSAARRITAFIEWFGDGMVNGEAVYGHIEPAGFQEPPLYARDLEALARLHRGSE